MFVRLCLYDTDCVCTFMLVRYRLVILLFIFDVYVIAISPHYLHQMSNSTNTLKYLLRIDYISEDHRALE